MKPTPVFRLSFLTLGAALAFGCASSSSMVAEQPPAPPAEKPAPQEVRIQPAAAPSLAPIYFDTDKSLLRADARAALKDMAQAIQQNPEWGVVMIEGHCDERGSDEYNVALGNRRASVVKQYLMDLGVPAKRLATVTFGESRPAVRGHDETAWRYNRRSELNSKSFRSATR